MRDFMCFFGSSLAMQAALDKKKNGKKQKSSKKAAEPPPKPASDRSRSPPPGQEAPSGAAETLDPPSALTGASGEGEGSDEDLRMAQFYSRPVWRLHRVARGAVLPCWGG